MSFLVLAASGFTEVRPGLIFWTLVTFLILAWVLRAKAWKPILDLAAEREKQIQNAIDAAKRERSEAEKLLAEQKMAIAEARREAAEMMRRNQADVERFRDELIAASRQEAEQLKADAQRMIQEETIRAIAEVKATAVDLAIDIAAKLLGERLDDAKQRALAQEFIDQLSTKDGFSTREPPSA
jgi:F-type H+-transporting ATPase subunit b